MNYGVNKASDRKNVRELLVNLSLIGTISAVVGTTEQPKEVKEALDGLGFGGFAETAMAVLATQVSGHRGRPALEEQPIHAILKGLREAAKVFTDTEDMNAALKPLTKRLKEAEKAQAHLLRRRAEFKPSKRMQGTKALPILAVATGDNEV
jgi:hypothetical protein